MRPSGGASASSADGGVRSHEVVELSCALLRALLAAAASLDVGREVQVAAALAVCLGDAKLSLVPFANPGLLVDAADDDVFHGGGFFFHNRT